MEVNLAIKEGGGGIGSVRGEAAAYLVHAYACHVARFGLMTGEAVLEGGCAKRDSLWQQLMPPSFPGLLCSRPPMHEQGRVVFASCIPAG